MSSMAAGRDPEALLEVLLDRDLCLLFRAFVKERQCGELLSFWFEVEEYKRLVSLIGTPPPPSSSPRPDTAATAAAATASSSASSSSASSSMHHSIGRESVGDTDSASISRSGSRRGSFFSLYSRGSEANTVHEALSGSQLKHSHEARKAAAAVYAKYIAKGAPYRIVIVSDDCKASLKRAIDKVRRWHGNGNGNGNGNGAAFTRADAAPAASQSKKATTAPTMELFDTVQQQVYEALSVTQLNGFLESRAVSSYKSTLVLLADSLTHSPTHDVHAHRRVALYTRIAGASFGRDRQLQAHAVDRRHRTRDLAQG